MDKENRTFGAILRLPSAFIPVAMSLAALAVLLCALVYGLIINKPLVREADEGAIAHIWQLLMAGQLPVLVYFVTKRLPRAPKPALGVLALQLVSALASMSPVYFLHL